MYGTPCHFHPINVDITNVITLGLMTEAEQGVKHDTRMRGAKKEGGYSRFSVTHDGVFIGRPRPLKM
jgi:hypothetical protein